MEKIIVGPSSIPIRPRKPSRPRRPKEMFKRTEIVWTSDDEDILLADVLHLIPADVPAQDIRISVDPQRVVITYDREIINTRFIEQMRDYTKRMAKYERELPEWFRSDAEWLAQKNDYDEELSSLQKELEDEFKNVCIA